MPWTDDLTQPSVRRSACDIRRPEDFQPAAAGIELLAPHISHSAYDGRPLYGLGESLARTTTSRSHHRLGIREGSFFSSRHASTEAAGSCLSCLGTQAAKQQSFHASGMRGHDEVDMPVDHFRHPPLMEDCIGAGTALVGMTKAFLYGHQGPEQGVCFYYPESGASSRQMPEAPSWLYAGPGRGDYEELRSYEYYGEGSGMPEPDLGVTWRLRRCWHVVFGCLFFTALIFACPNLVSAAEWAKGEGFDCDVDVAQWRNGWSEEKKTWCCRTSRKGCENPHEVSSANHAIVQVWPAIKWDTTTMASTFETSITTPLFECGVAPDGHSPWSAVKTAWCCINMHMACPRTTTSVPYDCWAGLANWERGWSAPKKSWCCEHQHVACPTPRSDLAGLAPPGITLPEAPSHVNKYICSGGSANGYTGWSLEKKAWCCEYRDRGCPNTEMTTTTANLVRRGITSATPIQAGLPPRS